jgi:Family of unknown function (DUF4006)
MFGLNGIGGMLIATVLLLSIIGFLAVNALVIQQRESTNYYKIDGEKEIKMIDSSAASRVVKTK